VFDRSKVFYIYGLKNSYKMVIESIFDKLSTE
jgi:hypothetical protein